MTEIDREGEGETKKGRDHGEKEGRNSLKERKVTRVTEVGVEAVKKG